MTTEKPEALRLARELEGVYPVNIQDQEAAAAELRRLHAKVTELEAQLEAIGAGGVGLLMARDQAEPATWECKAGGLKPLTQQQYDAQTDATKRHYTRIMIDQGELVAWQVWWGILDKQPHWPPYKTRQEAESAALQIKSNTEIRPLYIRQQPAKQETSGRVIATARALLTWIEWKHRPPVRDRIESGRMACVRLHALADLHDAVKAMEAA